MGESASADFRYTREWSYITSEENEIDRLQRYILSRKSTLCAQIKSVTKRRLREAKMRLEFIKGTDRPERKEWGGVINKMFKLLDHVKKSRTE